MLCLILLACGYSTRSLLPVHLKTVGIEPVENLTLQPDLGDILESSLREEFTHDRNLRVVDRDRADVMLRIQLVSYSREADAYTGDQRISSYRISAAASLSALDRVRDEPLYAGSIGAQLSYDPNSGTEEVAQRQLMTKLARDAVRVLLLAW